MTRHRGTITVRWHRAANADHYIVRLHTTLGQRLARVVRVRRASFAGLAVVAGGTVTVTAVTSDNRISRPGIARLAPIRRPKARHRPAIVGKPRVGKVLTCARFAFRGARGHFVLEWLRGLRPVHVGRTYRVRRSDAHGSLTCAVTARNVAGGTTTSSKAVRIR
jgi:hypothetical protein